MDNASVFKVMHQINMEYVFQFPAIRINSLSTINADANQDTIEMSMADVSVKFKHALITKLLSMEFVNAYRGMLETLIINAIKFNVLLAKPIIMNTKDV